MLFAVTCAFARQTETLATIGDQFDIVLTYDAPMTITPLEAPASYVFCTVEREGLASVFVSIAPSELTDGLSMAELGEEGRNMLTAMSASQYANPLTEVCATPSGNMYLSICSNEELEIDTLFTLYKGYFVELTQWAEEGGQLTDADEALLTGVLYGIDFVAR